MVAGILGKVILHAPGCSFYCCSFYCCGSSCHCCSRCSRCSRYCCSCYCRRCYCRSCYCAASTAAAAAAAAAIAAAALQWLLLQQALRAPFYRARIVAIPWDVRTAHVPPSIGPSFEDGTVPKVIFAGAKGASGRALSRKVIFQALRRVLGMALS